MLICLDAGHYLGTPGKRCLKRIDPNETREWVLNSRIADKVQQRLAGYDCTTIRVDDSDGKSQVTLDERTAMANAAGADAYISIHHNAGINGGKGGGIVVFAAPGCSEQSKVLQEAVYRHTVDTTGLRGNRSNPMPERGYKVLRDTIMPAILGEFGFMDSTTDTPIILTERFADQVADGIVAALVEVYGLEEKDMNEEQVRAIVRSELARMEKDRSVQPPSSWAKELLEEAKRKGITDGTRPRSFATREEVALMVNAAV